MTLTQREREIIAFLRRNPLAGAQAIADSLGTTRTAVNVHLSNLTKKGAILGRGYVLREENAVVVIGGANVDMKVHSLAPVKHRTSNPGRSSTAPGGVARNIAENLARLGTPTHLIAAIGHDPAGDRLLNETQAAGVRVDHLRRTAHATGTYTAVLDADGDLIVAIADMAATDALEPRDLHHARELIANASMLVLDGNLSTDVMTYAMDVAHIAGVPTLIDPVSVPKAALLAPLLTSERPIFALTPNAAELHAIVGGPVRHGADLDTSTNTNPDRDTSTDADGNRDGDGDMSVDATLVEAAAVLHGRGVRHVWVRLGARGSLLSSLDEGHTFLAAQPARVRDVTGAGDAMLGAFAHWLLQGSDPLSAARHGHAAAALTIESPATVRPDLTPRLVEDALNGSLRRTI